MTQGAVRASQRKAAMNVCVFPMTEGCFGFQPLATPGSSTQARHFGSRSRFINENKPMWVLAHYRLTLVTPDAAGLLNISAFALGCQQRFF